MDKYERRRLRLLRLRDQECNGSGAELARRIGRDQSYVTRMLYIDGKDGKRRIADDMVEIIETAFGLPRGWLDDTDGRRHDDQKASTQQAHDPQIDLVAQLMRAMTAAGKQRVIDFALGVSEVHRCAPAQKDSATVKEKHDAPIER